MCAVSGACHCCPAIVPPHFACCLPNQVALTVMWSRRRLGVLALCRAVLCCGLGHSGRARRAAVAQGAWPCPDTPRVRRSCNTISLCRPSSSDGVPSRAAGAQCCVQLTAAADCSRRQSNHLGGLRTAMVGYDSPSRLDGCLHVHRTSAWQATPLTTPGVGSHRAARADHQCRACAPPTPAAPSTQPGTAQL